MLCFISIKTDSKLENYRPVKAVNNYVEKALTINMLMKNNHKTS